MLVEVYGSLDDENCGYWISSVQVMGIGLEMDHPPEFGLCQGCVYCWLDSHPPCCDWVL